MFYFWLIIDILNVLKTFVLQAMMMFLGLIVVPIALCCGVVPYKPLSNSAFPYNHKLRKIFHPWDNDNDGIDGSFIWYSSFEKGNSQTFFRRFWWLAIRNACANYSRKIGVNRKVIVRLDTYGKPHVGNRKGYEGASYCIAMDNRDNRYPQFNCVRKWNETHCFRFTFGYSNNNIIEELLPCEHYYDFALSLQIYRKYAS